MAPGLPPFTFNLLPGRRLEAGWRPAEILLYLWLPLEGEDWGGTRGWGRVLRTEEPRPQDLFS